MKNAWPLASRFGYLKPPTTRLSTTNGVHSMDAVIIISGKIEARFIHRIYSRHACIDTSLLHHQGSVKGVKSLVYISRRSSLHFPLGEIAWLEKIYNPAAFPLARASWSRVQFYFGLLSSAPINLQTHLDKHLSHTSLLERNHVTF